MLILMSKMNYFFLLWSRDAQFFIFYSERFLIFTFQVLSISRFYRFDEVFSLQPHFHRTITFWFFVISYFYLSSGELIIAIVTDTYLLYVFLTDQRDWKANWQ
jgi:hypothetical protein